MVLVLKVVREYRVATTVWNVRPIPTVITTSNETKASRPNRNNLSNLCPICNHHHVLVTRAMYQRDNRCARQWKLSMRSVRRLNQEPACYAGLVNVYQRSLLTS